MYGRCYKRRYKFILSVRYFGNTQEDGMTKKMEKIQCFWCNIGLYKPVEAFKMDLEGSPPETTYERCKSQYVDLAKSLPGPWLPAAIVEPKKDDDTDMEQEQ
nr:hypothetical protein [Tanacetum cinerariifolium]